MKFPYTPISFAIADVRAEFKQMDQAGLISEEDCINWAVETMREIGGAHYPDQWGVIKVCNNTGEMPANFYVTDEVWLAEDKSYTEPSNTLIWFSKENCGYRPTQLLFPGDAMTGSKYSNGRVQGENTPNMISYVIRHPNQFRMSIPKATVLIKFLGLPMSENGEILMQDEINSIKAVKAYIKKMLLSEKYHSGGVSENVWQNIDREYVTNVDHAQAIFKFSDPADDRARGYIQDHRYDKFNLR